MSVPDQELIARVVSRKDQHAFAQLVLRYQSQLRTWARRLCNGDTHLADELAQETFMKAYAALGAFRAEAKFSTWLYRIASTLLPIAGALKKLNGVSWMRTRRWKQISAACNNSMPKKM